MTGSMDGGGGAGGGSGTGGGGGAELSRQLDDARAKVRLLTDQLAIAERVHQKLRGRIASLERALEDRGAPLPPQPVEPSDDDLLPTFGRAGGDISPPARPKAQVDPGEYGFGEHEDDLLPEPDPDEPHSRWRRPH